MAGRQFGLDARSVCQDPLLQAHDDADVSAAAAAEGRTLVTNNVQDFEAIRRRWISEGREPPPLIYTDDHTFPRDRRFVSKLISELHLAAEQSYATRSGGVWWLGSVSS